MDDLHMQQQMSKKIKNVSNKNGIGSKVFKKPLSTFQMDSPEMCRFFPCNSGDLPMQIH